MNQTKYFYIQKESIVESMNYLRGAGLLSKSDAASLKSALSLILAIGEFWDAKKDTGLFIKFVERRDDFIESYHLIQLAEYLNKNSFDKRK
jgi:hypothetical protein